MNTPFNDVSYKVDQVDHEEPSASASNTDDIQDEDDDDGDLFQCGKCLQQFSSLKLFLGHKRTRPPCTSLLARPADDVPVTDDQTSALLDGRVINGQTTTPEILKSDNAAPTSIIAREVGTGHVHASADCATDQFPSVVLNEAEFLSLTGIELCSLKIPNLSTSVPFNMVSPVSRSSQVKSTTKNALSDSHSTASAVPIIRHHLTPILPHTTSRRTPPECGSALLSNCPKSLKLPELPPLSSSVHGDAIDKETGSCMDILAVAHEEASDGRFLNPIDNNSLRSNAAVEGGCGTASIHAKTGVALLPIKCASSVVDQQLVAGSRLFPSSSKQMNLQCSYCDKLFTKNFDLQQHVRSHTGAKPFQCIVCGKAFAQKSNVKKHMSTHKVWPTELLHTLPSWSTICSDDPAVVEPESSQPSDVRINSLSGSSVSTELLRDADTESSPMKRTYYCQFCQACFNSYTKLKSHLNTHNNRKVYRCVVKACGQVFEELDVFLEHAKTHVNEASYRCRGCGKTLASLYDYGLHQHTQQAQCKEKVTARRFRCTKCIKRFATEEALEHHLTVAKHNVRCPTCDKVFPVERYLRRHLLTHKQASGEHRCSECHKTLKTETCLKTHMLIHGENSSFSCAICAAKFNRKDMLKRHALIHESVKRYKCPFRKFTGCVKEFHRSDKLKAHLLTHTAIKPHKCQHCRRSFTRQSNLRKHEQSYQGQCAAAAPSFSCDNCKQCFRTNAHLQKHSTFGSSKCAKKKDIEENEVRNKNLKAVRPSGQDLPIRPANNDGRRLRSSGPVEEIAQRHDPFNKQIVEVNCLNDTLH